MKRIGLLLVSWVFCTNAAFAAEAPSIREGFGCNLREGKTFDDFDVVTQKFRSALSGLDADTKKDYRVFIWTPYRGSVDVDLVWSSYFRDLRAYGDFSAAVQANPKAATAAADISEVVDCTSILQTYETIYQGKDVPDTEPPSLVQAFRCELNDGKGVDDARAAAKGWAKHIRSIPSYTNALGYMFTPIVGGSRFDLGYLVVHKDIQQFANRLADFQSSNGGGAVSAKLGEAAQCESALFLGRPLI